MGLGDFFDGIYCINLDERTDRWSVAQEQFEKLNIKDKVKRFSALKHEKGVIGCRESHINIIREAKELGLKNVLIFEDDVLIVNEDLVNIDKALSELSAIDWELFYLGATIDPNVGILTRISDNLVKTNFAYTTHAYAINNTMFDFILDQGPLYDIIDVFYCRYIVPRGNCYIINPMLCIQQESYSDIEKISSNYWWMLDFFDKGLKKGLN